MKTLTVVVSRKAIGRGKTKTSHVAEVLEASGCYSRGMSATDALEHLERDYGWILDGHDVTVEQQADESPKSRRRNDL